MELAKRTTVDDDTRRILVEKILDQTSDFDHGDLCEKFKLDASWILEVAIKAKLEALSIAELVEYL